MRKPLPAAQSCGEVFELTALPRRHRPRLKRVDLRMLFLRIRQCPSTSFYPCLHNNRRSMRILLSLGSGTATVLWCCRGQLGVFGWNALPRRHRPRLKRADLQMLFLRIRQCPSTSFYSCLHNSHRSMGILLFLGTALDTVLWCRSGSTNAGWKGRAFQSSEPDRREIRRASFA